MIEDALGPPKWHSRAPWFSRSPALDAISIDGNHQDIMDAEISYASAGAIDYWAYCWYDYGSTGGTDRNMQNAWNLHQSSSLRDKVRWCMIWQFSRLGGRKALVDLFDKVVYWFTMSNYFRVLAGRPLLYIFIDQSDVLKRDWGSDWTNVMYALGELRVRCRSESLGDPFIVIMYGEASFAADICRKTKSDAISNYMARVKPGVAVPYLAEDVTAQQYWQSMMESGCQIVPICQSGWDARPRKEYLARRRHQAIDVGSENFVSAGAPVEIANHIKNGFQFVADHPAQCCSNTLLVYSWNECDEGGGALIPTYGIDRSDTRILDAVGTVLRSFGNASR